MNSILLDTSFCIRLLKQDDALHKNAVAYFEYFLDNKIEMFLSSIVIAEYSVLDDVRNLPLKTMKITPFDYFDGCLAGEFHSILLQNRQQLHGLDRVAVKDDCKLMAQICTRKIDAYITKDKRSFKQVFQPVQKVKQFSIQLIDLSTPLNEFKNELF